MGDPAAKSGSDEQETHDSSTAPLIFFFSSSTSAFSSSRLDCAAHKRFDKQRHPQSQFSEHSLYEKHIAVTSCGYQITHAYRHCKRVRLCQVTHVAPVVILADRLHLAMPSAWPSTQVRGSAQVSSNHAIQNWSVYLKKTNLEQQVAVDKPRRVAQADELQQLRQLRKAARAQAKD